MLSKLRQVSLLRRSGRCFSSAAFNDWSRRMQEFESKYPKLYDATFKSDQENLLRASQSQLDNLVGTYENARKQIAEATGEDVFVALNAEELRANPPQMVQSAVQSRDEAQMKLQRGTDLVERLQSLQATQGSLGSVEERNLRIIEIGEIAEEIESWRARLDDEVGDNTDMGLPIEDEELDDWVTQEYYHAPGDVRNEAMPNHKQLEQTWMEGVDERLIDMLKERDPGFDEAKWRKFCEVTNEIFHPHRIDHYGYSNYAKCLFRSALWQSEDRLPAVEASMRVVSQLYNGGKDQDALILRRMYEMYPDHKVPGFAALHCQIADPLFAASLVDEARALMDRKAFDRAVKDVMRPVEMQFLEEDKASFEDQLKTATVAENSLRRNIANIDAEIATFNVEPPNLEAVLDELLPARLWGRDPSAVKAAILKYAAGSGSLSDVDAAIQSTLNPSAEVDKFTDEDILIGTVRYHNARMTDMSYWNFKDFLKGAEFADPDTILKACRIVKQSFDKLQLDPLVRNLVRVVIEDNQTSTLGRVIEDFQNIMKTYKGEIDGTVISAEELDDATFAQIQNALESANVGKTITLTRQVEPGLGAGFVVKAGVQRFDFSLAAHIAQSRKQLAV